MSNRTFLIIVAVVAALVAAAVYMHRPRSGGVSRALPSHGGV